MLLGNFENITIVARNRLKWFRNKVKNFAQTTANSQRADGKKCPKFKLIILDEADSMTKAAQEALRRTMEVYRNCMIKTALTIITLRECV